jgi:hypothetical protein
MGAHAFTASQDGERAPGFAIQAHQQVGVDVLTSRQSGLELFEPDNQCSGRTHHRALDFVQVIKAA